MLQERSGIENKVQGEASDSSTDTQKKGVEFLENPKKPDGSYEDSLYSNGDKQGGSAG